MKKRLITTLLVSVMLLTACGSESAPSTQVDTESKQQESTQKQESTQESVEAESQYPEYLNLESAYPVVKDEYADDITLSVVMLMQDNAGDWEDLWISKYFKEKYNVNLEVEYLYAANYEERTNLMLNSGDLPDMMINLGISNASIVKYGAKEGIFLQLDQYMDETLTPNILKYMEGTARTACTALDGHIYSLPNLSNEYAEGIYKRVFINRAWLEALKLEMPRTLDQFVDAMYAIKEADPAGVGKENLYPFGSGDKRGTGNGWYILNALGYIENTNYNGDGYGIDPCIRDGEVVIPVYDMEVYQEYLKIMNQFYTDGIINPTFFTIEESEMNAQMMEGKTALYHNAPFLSGIETYDDWESGYPLTSEWQTEPEIGTNEYATVGNFLVSADTEYPELCLRFADIFFNNETDTAYAIDSAAPAVNSGWDFGGVTRYWNDETQKMGTNKNWPAGVENGWQYTCEYGTENAWQFGATNIDEAKEKMAADLGHPEYRAPRGKNTGANAWSNSVYTNMVPYGVVGFPLTYYMEEETADEMNELLTVITPYVEEQVALFITGRRPLSETGDFVKELEKLGIDDLLDIYKEIYAMSVQ